MRRKEFAFCLLLGIILSLAQAKISFAVGSPPIICPVEIGDTLVFIENNNSVVTTYKYDVMHNSSVDGAYFIHADIYSGSSSSGPWTLSRSDEIVGFLSNFEIDYQHGFIFQQKFFNFYIDFAEHNNASFEHEDSYYSGDDFEICNQIVNSDSLDFQINDTTSNDYLDYSIQYNQGVLEGLTISGIKEDEEYYYTFYLDVVWSEFGKNSFYSNEINITIDDILIYNQNGMVNNEVYSEEIRLVVNNVSYYSLADHIVFNKSNRTNSTAAWSSETNLEYEVPYNYGIYESFIRYFDSEKDFHLFMPYVLSNSIQFNTIENEYLTIFGIWASFFPEISQISVNCSSNQIQITYLLNNNISKEITWSYFSGILSSFNEISRVNGSTVSFNEILLNSGASSLSKLNFDAQNDPESGPEIPGYSALIVLGFLGLTIMKTLNRRK